MFVNASNLIRKSALFTLLLCSHVLFATHAQSSNDRFDGKWRLSLTYSRISSSNSRCSGDMRPDPMTISNGILSGLLNHSDRGACYMGGAVDPNGALENAVCDSARPFYFKGRLDRDAGKGTWQEPDYDQCDGLWTAKKIN